jgi:hypothetical protein
MTFKVFLMQRLLLIGSVALALTPTSSTSAAPNCASFSANADGSWSVTRRNLFATPSSKNQNHDVRQVAPADT